MYFLWKRTPHGSIRVSYDGLADLSRRCLTRKSQFRSVALAEGETAVVTLVLSSRDGSLDSKAESCLNAVMKPLGMLPSIVWSSRGSPEEEWCELRFALLHSPWAWMSMASAVALVVLAGWDGFFWTSFWGTAAWFLVKGVTSLLFKHGLPIVLPVERR